MDICVDYIEIMGSGFVYYTLLLLLYFVLIGCYTYTKYNKKYITLYDIILNAVLHCRLIFVLGSFVAMIGALGNYMLNIVNSSFNQLEGSKFVGTISEWGTLTLKFADSEGGKAITVWIMLSIFFLLILILYKKTNQKFWTRFISFMIASIILRHILLNSVVVVFPSDIAEIAVNVLTAKLILNDLFKECFSGYDWYDSLSLKKFLYWLQPVYHCDTTYGEWREELSRRFEEERTKLERPRSLDAFSVGTMFYDPGIGFNVINRDLSDDDLKSLLFINERCYYKSFVFVRGGDDDSFYPISYAYLLPDFFNGEPSDVSPFPFVDKCEIPLYEKIGAFPDIPSLVEFINNKTVLPETVVLSTVEYHDGDSEEIAHFVFRKQHNIVPTVVRDWNAQNKVFIDMGDNNYIKYNPYYLTEEMIGKRIAIKYEEGRIVPTSIIVDRLYKTSEVNYRNSFFSRYWRFSVEHLKSKGRPFSLAESLRITYALEKSPIFRNINFNNIDWSSGNSSQMRNSGNSSPMNRR